MTERIGPLGPTQKTKTEEDVRGELLTLASDLIERAKRAGAPEDARTYAESAAVVFDAAATRYIDVPPNGGRVASAALDVPPNGG